MSMRNTQEKMMKKLDTEEPVGGEAQSAALVAREACFDAPAGLSDALQGAANYIDVLGGDSKKYRAALAASAPGD